MSEYDPVYAHEYYMKHRQLKGRKKSSTNTSKATYKKLSYSGLGLSKEQKAQLKDYWTQLKSDLADEKESINAAKTATIERMNEVVNSKLELLKELVKGTNNSSVKSFYRNQMKQLREIRKDTRASIVAKAKADYDSAKKKTYDSYNSRVRSMAR